MIKRLFLIAALLSLTLTAPSQSLPNTLIAQGKLNCADQAGATFFNWYWAELLFLPGQPWQLPGMVSYTSYSMCENEL